ncbi:MAG TPA: aminotransferase class I/II-fold pyridoxal phosphate-dependent enzyme [Vicinamibacterales bacterium]|nr:aminotransferase class I/II-fold pyridoxal phosphate-dependent enzyme [Vicinamibacterales bacterium]
MTTRIRAEVGNVAESPMVLIATIAESMPGSLKLCYGESDMPTPEFICRAADEAVRNGHTFYTHTAGYRELREAIAAKVFALHGVTYRGSEVMSTVGASMAIFTAIRTCVGPGDNAVIISPTYAIFSNGVILSGGEPRPVALARDGARFRLDVDRVRAAIDSRTRMLIVNSPCNPTGWVISVDDQRALAELAERHDLVILSDEVYERLVFDAPIAASMARVMDKDRLIVVNSFSKTYNMTGWRLGWAQSSEPMIRAMYKAAEFITSNATAMVQQAGIVALRDGEPYIADLRAHYTARRDQVVTALGAIPGVSLPEPQGAFYAFPRTDGLVDSTDFTARLVKETGVAFAPGVGFGASGEGYIRMCFAASEQTVTEALARFTGFMSVR